MRAVQRSAIPAPSYSDLKWASGLTFGTSYRVVSSYEYDTGVGELWINPVDESSTKISYTSTFLLRSQVAQRPDVRDQLPRSLLLRVRHRRGRTLDQSRR